MFLPSYCTVFADITISFDDPGVVIEGYPMEVCLSIEGAPASTCPSSVPLKVVLQTFDGTARKSCGS